MRGCRECEMWEKKHNSIESNTQFNLACKFKSLEFLMWHRRTSYTTHTHKHTTSHPRFVRKHFIRIVRLHVSRRCHAMRFICLKSSKSIANSRICSSGSASCSSSRVRCRFTRALPRHTRRLSLTWFENQKSFHQYYAKHTAIKSSRGAQEAGKYLYIYLCDVTSCGAQRSAGR